MTTDTDKATEVATDTRPYTTTFTISREAMDVMSASSNHCEQLRVHYGEASRQYLEAVASWQRQVTRIFAHPMGADVAVTRDGDKSLLVFSRQSGFVFGVIWHGIKRLCSREGCKAVINDDGKAWTYLPDWPVCADGKHEPDYPLDAPQPGSWSFHS